jgi:hypothetical protein
MISAAGTVFYVAFRGQWQVDTNFQAGKDAIFVQQDSNKNGTPIQ